MPSSPPPDRFQREIDDIIRLAERRLEHQSFRYRMRRSTRRLGNAFGGFAPKLPNAETLGGWGLALLLLTLALISSLLRGRGTSGAGGTGKMWRGERVTYGNPYGESWLNRLRRMFRGR